MQLRVDAIEVTRILDDRVADVVSMGVRTDDGINVAWPNTFR
jgi:hypothetical protein